MRTDAGRVEVGLPPLQVPAEWAAEWLPLIRRWVAEHQDAGASAKVAAAQPIVQRWEYLAALHARRFAGETGEGAGGAGVCQDT